MDDDADILDWLTMAAEQNRVADSIVGDSVSARVHREEAHARVADAITRAVALMTRRKAA